MGRRPFVFPPWLFTVPHAPILSLWPEGNPDGWTRPGAEETVRLRGETFHVVRNVSQPTLQFFRAPRARPHAPTVLVCPGGGYTVEAIEHEGREIAARLNGSGVHAALLKYRLPNLHADRPLHRAPLQDLQRAVRLVRFHAAEWRVEASRVGVLGFSAGGHLAASSSNAHAATYAPLDAADAQSANPDFTVLVYPAYLTPELRPAGLCDLAVTQGAPPAFVVQTLDDGFAGSALAYAEGCRDAGVAVEMHLFPKGGHGYGLRTQEPGLSAWPDLLVAWLRRTMPF